MKKVHIKQDYAKLRREAYPDVGDQLEAIWIAISAVARELPPEVLDMLDRIQRVKDKFPKKQGVR
jgi:hypothetical protein